MQSTLDLISPDAPAYPSQTETFKRAASKHSRASDDLSPTDDDDEQLIKEAEAEESFWLATIAAAASSTQPPLLYRRLQAKSKSQTQAQTQLHSLLRTPLLTRSGSALKINTSDALAHVYRCPHAHHTFPAPEVKAAPWCPWHAVKELSTPVRAGVPARRRTSSESEHPRTHKHGHRAHLQEPRRTCLECLKFSTANYIPASAALRACPRDLAYRTGSRAAHTDLWLRAVLGRARSIGTPREYCSLDLDLMADVVGLVASILQLVEMVAKARKHVKDFRDAPKDQQRLLVEIQNLDSLLEALDKRVGNDTPAGRTTGMQEVGALIELKRTMERLTKKLDSDGISKFSSRLTWPLWGKEDVQEGLNSIERFKGLAIAWLGLDIWFVFHLSESMKPKLIAEAGIPLKMYSDL
ncbi:hypothetical protein B0H14DRAFT_3476891 [Mycena olivaceomarginata]|nr:hypothetical protein B0H14DRAFT_3476891 [Mycena olivaceomarginata]